ncbi:conserved hypothetical protein [Coccidioides posadasii str. Silveira]|uniref:Uncharacterized protein n=1 Tax=Coccidioides posadasii (strain RMSCC 757 / Silveira) TaxID=443226 RepID=E9DFI2_COCPS|nr:conserved hypothetical protein [Coccidioides posadasii str. Silveira]
MCDNPDRGAKALEPDLTKIRPFISIFLQEQTTTYQEGRITLTPRSGDCSQPLSGQTIKKMETLYVTQMDDLHKGGMAKAVAGLEGMTDIGRNHNIRLERIASFNRNFAIFKLPCEAIANQVSGGSVIVSNVLLRLWFWVCTALKIW